MTEKSKGMQVVRTLRQVMESMKQTMMKEFKGMNLTGPQGMLIRILIHEGEMKISDLSERLNLSNSTVSGIVDRLEKQGLVERTRSEEDRRVVYVNISPEFRKASEDRFKEIERNLEEKLNCANEDELDRILEGLNTLKNMLDKNTEE